MQPQIVTLFGYKSAVCSKSFSAAGDTTVQLLWRIQNGELPATTDTKQAVVLIGTNDLTAYHQHQVQITPLMLKYVMLLQRLYTVLRAVVRCPFTRLSCSFDRRFILSGLLLYSQVAC